MGHPGWEARALRWNAGSAAPQLPFFLPPVFGAGSVSPKPRWRLRFRRAAPPISHPLSLRGVGLFRRPCFFVVSGNLIFFFSLAPELQKMPLASLIDPFSPSLTWGGAGRRTDYLFG